MQRIIILSISLFLVHVGFTQPTYINTQEQIDSFQVNYPGVTELSSLFIVGSEITNLEGLSVITTIYNFLTIEQCYNLTSLSGLQNLSYLGITAGLAWGLHITDNSSLKNMNGLDNLSTIAGRLEITFNDSLTSLLGLENLQTVGDGLFIENNPSLKSLSGLSNLSTVGMDGIKIYNNDQLTNLFGLENINGSEVEYLLIADNDTLSNCHAQSVCDYLISPNGSTDISDNAFGCNNIEEVEEACGISGLEEYNLMNLSILPNPTDNGNITITFENAQNNLHLICFNIFGQQFHQQLIHSTETMINVSNWPCGIYIVLIYENGKPVSMAKFVVR